MKNLILNTDYHTYLIKFQFQSTNCRFIVQGSGLVEVLKTYDQNGVDYIKEFNPVKGNFQRIAKSVLLNRFTWDTETYLYLQKHYFFK